METNSNFSAVIRLIVFFRVERQLFGKFRYDKHVKGALANPFNCILVRMLPAKFAFGDKKFLVKGFL